MRRVRYGLSECHINSYRTRMDAICISSSYYQSVIGHAASYAIVCYGGSPWSRSEPFIFVFVDIIEKRKRWWFRPLLFKGDRKRNFDFR